MEYENTCSFRVLEYCLEQFILFILIFEFISENTSPSQAHNGVQSILAFLHLHFLTQLFCHLQTSSWQTLDTSGSGVQRGSYIPLVLI